jgi:cytochrome c oxidase subunit 4
VAHSPAHGAAAHDHGHDDHGGHHISPLSTYFLIYGALLVLTVVTVLVSYAELPPAQSVPAAIAVATVKAGLVAGWFMHLKYDARFNVFVFLGALWFMAAFFVFTFFDLASRDMVHEVTGQFELRRDELGR